MAERFVDLHAHTTASDGTTPPKDLVALAHARGLAAVAVTDHDTVAGVPEARAAGEALGVEVVAGVELSIEGPGGIEIHMLGYFVDTANPEFLSVIGRARDSRGPRNAAIVRRLQELGLDVTMADVEAEAAAGASSGKSVGRPHVAAALMRKGHVASITEAFDRYLAEGAAAFAPRARLMPEDAVRAVRAAGGVAVLAHPCTVPEARRRDAVAALATAGLAGIEVIYPKHDDGLRAALTELAKEHDLVVTGGSDFHGANKPDIELGTGRGGNVRVPYAVLEALRARRT